MIDREELGLDNVSWTELLKPEILGMLSFSSADGLSVQSGSQQTELSLGETTMIVRSGLGTIDHDPRVCFIIDADTFKVDDVVNAGFADIDQILDELHAPVSTFFRQSITSMLHESMEPTDLRG